MNEDSGFFTPLQPDKQNVPMELIHSSGSGWSELYRIDKDGRFRVLKALKPEYRGQSLYESLLRKEYEIGYSLSHPYICEVYGFVDLPDVGHAIEMEWVDGAPLSDLLQRRRLPHRDAKRIAAQLCDALSYLHSKQVVHRDIKPSNVLVTHNGKNLKLIDFGLSDTDSFAMLKGAAGTESFAAPELHDGTGGDWRSDIWSLGKVIGLMLPSSRNVVRRCTSELPEKRYSDASDVKAALMRKPLWPWCLVLMGAAALFMALVTRNDVAVNEPEPLLHAEDSSVVTDPAVIDELFMQATDMIESR